MFYLKRENVEKQTTDPSIQELLLQQGYELIQSKEDGVMQKRENVVLPDVLLEEETEESQLEGKRRKKSM